MKWCWKCWMYRLEPLGLRYYISRRFKCFYCRIDTLDKKYGPSQQAELWRRTEKYKRFFHPYRNSREFAMLLFMLRHKSMLRNIKYNLLIAKIRADNKRLKL